ncbi:MAG: hypothetical protein GY765_27465 [bacterium]|nr:hypothetical protein [bacterium]
MLDGGRNVIIFSCIADTFSLDKYIHGSKTEIHIDTLDEFNLMTVITNESSSPLVIDGETVLNKE